MLAEKGITLTRKYPERLMDMKTCCVVKAILFYRSTASQNLNNKSSFFFSRSVPKQWRSYRKMIKLSYP